MTNKFKMSDVCAFLLLISFVVLPVYPVRYTPDWKSLDSRPLPSWYDEAKIGIFIHWSVFSVPSYHGAWFQYWLHEGRKFEVDFMKKNYRPGFTYADFASQFTAEFYDPDHWAEVFEAAGARYVVLTTKHHEGFCNWPTKYSFNWNSMDVGPKRDLVGDLGAAVRKKNLRYGLYHSLFEFFNPMFLEDKNNKFRTQTFVNAKTLPELYELVKAYEPDIVWSDGPETAPDWYYNSTNFLAWLYNESPVKDTVVVNDRWGMGTECKHGGFWNCQDQYNPGILVPHKWENAHILDKTTWAYHRDIKVADVSTMDELTEVLASTVSCGGNLLLNIGPTKEGTIIPIYEERLRQLGEWLAVNGEAIYSTRPWTYQNDTTTSGVWYTSKKTIDGTAVYAIVLDWPRKDVLFLEAPDPTPSTTVQLLGYPKPFPWKPAAGQGILISIPVIPFYDMPCSWAWVLKMLYLKN